MKIKSQENAKAKFIILFTNIEQKVGDIQKKILILVNELQIIDI